MVECREHGGNGFGNGLVGKVWVREGRKMQLKTGVRVRGICPEIILALHIADEIYRKYFASELVVTSLVDGVHSAPRSKHYLGQAADLRIWGLEGRVESIVSALKAALGDEYDIIAESDHIHMEFDPVEMKTGSMV